MNLEIQARGSEVRELQISLNRALAGQARLVPDGVFGARTQRALIAFQRRQGLQADGVAGPATWKALGRRDPDAPRPRVIETGTEPEWLQIARAEAQLGVKEDPRLGKQNKRIIEYHALTTLAATTDETAWCSSFVNWVLWQAGYVGTRSAAAKSWLTWRGGT